MEIEAFMKKLSIYSNVLDMFYEDIDLTIRCDGVYKEYDTTYFIKNGNRHRLDGPAIEWKDGSKFWYKDGKEHREDGPAIEYSNSVKEWWLSGQQIFRCSDDYIGYITNKETLDNYDKLSKEFHQSILKEVLSR
jgi:hypothetical protein